VIPTTVKGLLIDIEGASDYPWIGPISSPSYAITHHGDWRRAALIVPSSEGASGIRTDSEHGEIIAGNVFASAGLGGLWTPRTPDAEEQIDCRENRQFDKAFGIVSL
jgi:hypothetical protein